MEYDSMHQYMLENACIFTKFYFGETRKRYGMGLFFFYNSWSKNTKYVF